MEPTRSGNHAASRTGSSSIGVAQEEKAQAFPGKKGAGQFQCTRHKTAYVNHDYFYLEEAAFGPLFIQVCRYAPGGSKLRLNGHAWAKRQWKKTGIADEDLDHGFLLSWADAQKRQEICDSLGPEEIAGLFRTWWKRMALPLRPEERAAGYDGSLSSWQRAVSLTQIFDRPWRGREFFEEIIPDNRDRGRPDRGQLLFDRVVTKKTPGQFRPRGIQQGVPPSRHIHDQHFDRKPYGKEGRGCRTEGTFRNRQDFGVNKGLFHLPYWQKIGRAIHRRLLQVERVSHTSGLRGDSLQRVVPPSVTDDAEKAPALPFGPPRVMALLGALTLFPRLIDGLHNPDLRTRIVDLWGLTSNEHTASQMSYHRRRWRRKGLIFRPPKTQRDVLTPHGWKIARLFTGLEARGFRPAPAMFTSNDALLPFPLRASWDRVDAQLDQWIDEAFPPAKAS